MTQSCVATKAGASLAAKAAVFCFLLIGAFRAAAGPTPLTGDYRSKAAGNLDSPAIWEQLTASGWVAAANAPATASAASLFIHHPVIASAAFTNTSITVAAGGSLTVAAGGTVTGELLVQQGGVLQVNNLLTIGTAGMFSVENGATLALNYAFANPETSIWNGTENFAPGSTLKIQNWNAAQPVLNNSAAITATTASGFSAVFGDLVLDFADIQVQNLRLMSASFNKNLAHGSVTFSAAAAGSTVMVGGSGSVINGKVVVGPGFGGSTLSLAAGQLTVNGSLQQNGGLVYAANSSGIIATLTVKGNLQVLGGTFDLLPAALPSGSGAALNLAGNLEVMADAQLTNSHTAAADAGRVAFNFTGTTPQLVAVAPLVQNVPFRITAGARVVLGANMKVNRSTIATIVQTGATLDFNGFAFEGTSGFTQMAQAMLRITSPLGLDADGNVQSSVSGRKFDKDGIYHFAGNSPQITGQGLNPASGQKVIIIDNPTSVTLTNPVSFSTTGGEIDIRQGKLQETETGYFMVTNSSNSVKLTMAANTHYRTAALVSGYSAGNLSFPQAGGTWTLDPTCTLELSGNGPQVLRSSTTSKTYGNLTFSNSGTKTLANNVAQIAGTVTISDLAVLDAQANSFGGAATNFTMTGGRFRTSRSGTQPLMNGVYNLSGGVVEFYGTTATSAMQTVRGGKTYFNIELSAEEANTTAYNVLHGAGMVTMAGEFKINAPVVYQIAGSNNYIVGASPTSGSFAMQPGATLKYGDKYGITSQSCGTTAACGNIRTPLRDFPEEASYGVIGSSANMVTGNGLPAHAVNFYLDRSNTGLVTLTNPLKIANALIFRNGKLKTTETAVLTFGEQASQTGASANSYVAGPVVKAGSSAFTFPIGNDTYFAPAGILATPTETTIFAQYIGQSAATVLLQNPANSLASPLYDLARNECWKIARQAGSAPLQVALTWETTRSGEFANPEDLVVARLNNTAWFSDGATDPEPDAPENQVTAGRAVNSVGYFALGFADFSLGFSTLPVELVSFSGKLHNQHAELNWVTATEKDNAYFDVERSTDGVQFVSVGRLASAGNSSRLQTYRFTDPEPVVGAAYYRLRQTDLDGASTLSRPIYLPGIAVSLSRLALYPNPVQQQATVLFENPEAGEVTLTVMGIDGKLVFRKTAYANQGENEITLPAGALQPGVYVLEVATDTTRATVRFEKF